MIEATRNAGSAQLSLFATQSLGDAWDPAKPLLLIYGCDGRTLLPPRAPIATLASLVHSTGTACVCWVSPDSRQQGAAAAPGPGLLVILADSTRAVPQWQRLPLVQSLCIYVDADSCMGGEGSRTAVAELEALCQLASAPEQRLHLVFDRLPRLESDVLALWRPLLQRAAIIGVAHEGAADMMGAGFAMGHAALIDPALRPPHPAENGPGTLFDELEKMLKRERIRLLHERARALDVDVAVLHEELARARRASFRQARDLADLQDSARILEREVASLRAEFADEQHRSRALAAELADEQQGSRALAAELAEEQHRSRTMAAELEQARRSTFDILGVSVKLSWKGRRPAATED